jgi:Ca2+-binding EF-hand superfamily protein
MIDTDNSGTITFEELKHGLKRVGSQMTETEIKDLMDAVNTYKKLDKEKKKNFLLLLCFCAQQSKHDFFILLTRFSG